MEAHSTISTEKKGASHSLVGDNAHPNCKGRGRCAGVVELDGHSGLSVCAEQLSDPKPLHVLGVVDRTQDASAARVATI